ncbi:MAG: large conductance mechanosensitive channel protein MscL [Cyanobacteria bacterium CRU_2_1]|nr:large conductance mechanosensitive channel protein MscL [Cyanobacteria bacterium RU_5_0]NJR61964.1 large conductance mechanosensitive channel protein MscL [Cyanobacteria bacterium CRU_2_1]
MAVRRGRRAATGFAADFRDFIMRGNVVDLAVGVVIGAAFTGIVNSLVADVITPALLDPALKAAGVTDLEQLAAGSIKYGKFIAAILSFIVIAFVIFLLIRSFEAAKRQFIREDEDTPAPDPAIVAQERLTGAVERLTEVMESQPR